MRVFNFKKKCEIKTVAIDPSARWVAAAGGPEPTAVWDMTTGNKVDIATTHGVPYPSWQVLFLNNSQLLISTAQGLYQCDLERVATKAIITDGPMIHHMTTAPTGSWAVCSHRYHSLTRYTVLDRVGQPKQRTLWSINVGDTDNESGYSSHLACLADGKRFFSAEDLLNRTNGWHRRYRIAIRSRKDGQILNTAEGLFGYGDRVFATHVSDTFVILSGVWLRVHGIDEPSIKRHVVRNDGKKHFTAVAFHPSGKYLAVTSNDTTVKLFDMRTWDVVRTFTWDIGRMRSIAFSPDGNLAVAGGDQGKIVVWDVDV